ncbi:MAG: zinc ribbon domain-containing protein [Chloroflexota bacterium]
MPIYDYVCTACDHRADILHGINDPGPNFCPSCGKEGTMRKLFSAPSIHFKGSGWAKKDRGGGSSTKAAAKAASTGASSEASGSSSDASSTTSAPAAKSDSTD